MMYIRDCILLGAVVILFLSSCSPGSSPALQAGVTQPEELVPIEVVEGVEYTEGRELAIFTPEGEGAWPIVVLFHGGGTNGQSLYELSAEIASRGAIVFTPTWSSSPPQAANITRGWDEAVCSLRYVNAYIEENGLGNSRVVLIGHSAGGASGFIGLVAAEEFAGDCPSDTAPVLADAFIGLDGAYNILDFVPSSRLQEGDPAEWQRINPYHYLDGAHFRADAEITLVAGSQQELIDIAGEFKEALEEAGYRPSYFHLPERDHWGVATAYPDVLERIFNVLYP